MSDLLIEKGEGTMAGPDLGAGDRAGRAETGGSVPGEAGLWSAREVAGRLRAELAAYGVGAVVLESGPVAAVSAGDVLVWVEPLPDGGWVWVWPTGRVHPVTGRRVRTWCAWPKVAVAARRIAGVCRQAGGEGEGWWTVLHGRGGARVGDGVPLRHGFTLGDLDRLVRRVALGRARRSGLSPSERRAVAWSAMAEELCVRGDAPSEGELLRRGERAINDHAFAELRTHGISDRAGRGHHDPGGWETRGFMPRFEAFWYTASSSVVSHEGRVVEVLALAQVWRRLSRRNREVLAALAEHDSAEDAAEALGVSRVSVSTLVYHARKQFLRLWHDGEEPSRLWGRGVPRNPELRRYTSSGAWALGTLRRRDRKRSKRRRREGEAR